MGPFATYTENFASGPKRFSSAEMVVLDPEATDAPIVLEATGTFALGLPLYAEASPASAPGTLLDLQDRLWTYLKNGRLMSLDLKRGANFLEPRPVSSITMSQVCYDELRDGPRRAFSDLTSALRSGLVFRLPGADGVCQTADDHFRAVTMDMSESNPGINTLDLVATISNANGAIAAHIVRDGNMLKRVDTSFANPTDLVAVGNGKVSAVNIANQLLFAGVFLYQDGSDIRAYHLSTGAGPVTVATLSPTERTFAYQTSDENYLQILDTASSRVVRITNSLTASDVVTEAGFMSDLAFTPTHLAYSVVYAGTTQRAIRSVPKDGGAPTTLTACHRPTAAQSFVFAFGDNLYCGPFAFLTSLAETAAGVTVLKVDGTVVRTIANATMVMLGRLNPQPVTFGTYETVLVAEGLSSSTSSYKGATLRLYNGLTDALIATYGTIDVSATQLSGAYRDLSQFAGAPKLLTAMQGLQPTATNKDLFVLRDQPPSLTRRTHHLP